MRRVVWTLRRTAMVGVAAGSVIGAGALTRALQVGELRTALLLVILALFILPLATFAAWLLDRKAAREEVRPESTLEENGLFELPKGVEVVEEPPAARTSGGRPRHMHAPHRRRGARASRRM